MEDVEGFTETEIEQLRKAVQFGFSVPPTIGLVGMSGTGKSSTINELFGQKLKTSDTVRCTTEFCSLTVNAKAEVDILPATSGNVRKTKNNGKTTELIQATLRVFDAPGLGEDLRKDPEYLEMYKKFLPKCDVILWVMTARNRAVALDQQYLQELGDFHDKIVFGINQVDLVEPCNWNKNINLPSNVQEENIRIILGDRKERMEAILKRPVRIVAYGAKQQYQLSELFKHLIDACQNPERRWLFEAIKKISPETFLEKVSPKAREHLLQQGKELTIQSSNHSLPLLPKKSRVAEFVQKFKFKKV